MSVLSTYISVKSTYLQEEKANKELAKERDMDKDDDKKDEDKPRPNPALEQGATLPSKMGEFPPEMFGLPIEDVDEYYFNKYVSVLLFFAPITFISEC